MEDPTCQNLAPAPRQVPTSAAVQLLFQGPQPTVVYIGWSVLLLSVLFCWLTVPRMHLIDSIRYTFGDTRTTTALILDSGLALWTSGTGRRTRVIRNNVTEPTYCVRYTYSVDGHSYTGASYTKVWPIAPGMPTIQPLIEDFSPAWLQHEPS